MNTTPKIQPKRGQWVCECHYCGILAAGSYGRAATEHAIHRSGTWPETHLSLLYVYGIKPLVKVTSHVDPPYSCTYTLGEFIDANLDSLEPADILCLTQGHALRLGGGAAPIVDVVPEEA